MNILQPFAKHDGESSFPDQALLAKGPLRQPTYLPACLPAYPPTLATYVNHFVYF